MTKNPKKGDTVVVYEDPITELKPEGEAKLVVYIGTSQWTKDLQVQSWKVRFTNEPQRVFERRILAEMST